MVNSCVFLLNYYKIIIKMWDTLCQCTNSTGYGSTSHTTFYQLKFFDIVVQLVHFDNYNNRCITGKNINKHLSTKFSSTTSYFVLEEMEIVRN